MTKIVNLSSEFLSKSTRVALYLIFGFVEFFGDVATSILSCTLAVLAGQTWHNLAPEEKFEVCGLIFLNSYKEIRILINKIRIALRENRTLDNFSIEAEPPDQQKPIGS